MKHKIVITLEMVWDDNAEVEGTIVPKTHPSKWDWRQVIDEPEIRVLGWEDQPDPDDDDGYPLFEVVGGLWVDVTEDGHLEAQYEQRTEGEDP